MTNELEQIYEAELATFQKVVELIARGKTPSQIQTETGVLPAQQRKIYKQFEDYANNDFQTQKRAKAIVAELDVQYTYIIRELETILEQIEESIDPDLKLKKETLKELANVNKMRADQLQRAGVLNSEAVGAEMAALQKEHDAIVALFKKLGKELKGPQYRHLRKILEDGLAEIRGEVLEVRDE